MDRARSGRHRVRPLVVLIVGGRCSAAGRAVRGRRGRGLAHLDARRQRGPDRWRLGVRRVRRGRQPGHRAGRSRRASRSSMRRRPDPLSRARRPGRRRRSSSRDVGSCSRTPRACYAAVADLTYTGGFAATGGALALRAVGGRPIDAVGWGDAASGFVEGTSAPRAAGGVEPRARARRPGRQRLRTRTTTHSTGSSRARRRRRVLVQPPVPAPGPTPTAEPDARRPRLSRRRRRPPCPPPAHRVARPRRRDRLCRRQARRPRPTPTATPIPTPIPAAIPVAAARALPDDAEATIEGTLTTALGALEAGARRSSRTRPAGSASTSTPRSCRPCLPGRRCASPGPSARGSRSASSAPARPTSSPVRSPSCPSAASVATGAAGEATKARSSRSAAPSMRRPMP